MIGRLRAQILLSATWFLPSERIIKLVICVCAILAPDSKRVAEILKLTIQPGFNMDARAYIIVHIHTDYLGRYRISTYDWFISGWLCQFQCSVTYDKTKCHRSPSLMSYNISEMTLIQSNQIKRATSGHTVDEV